MLQKGDGDFDDDVVDDEEVEELIE